MSRVVQFISRPLPREADSALPILEAMFDNLSASLQGLDDEKASVVSVPPTATSPGSPGDIAFDTNHIYICVATDTWRRVALSTW